ncbi:M28 family metallopeptidase [Qipengyuania aquimaris]|uniref:M28 family metallopeptidase n=1 Tax=Qipengyuania aquimaris TaxID=255984 RepID=UPI001FD0BAA0|nr:M28 family metallopeptidase [Qipengyuania aquimaris]UOR14577.1 M28 family metallopeptidase [Qipengyuania aquimaris]
MTTIREILGRCTACLLVLALSASAYASDPGVLTGERASIQQRAEAADMLVAQLNRAGIEGRRMAYDLGTVRREEGSLLDRRGINIVAKVDATVQDAQTIVIGAHYDTVAGSPGADDNASGAYAVLRLAERVAEMPRRRHNVVFVWFDQEEVGLVGSRVFAKSWKRSGESLHSMHNIDMIGFDGNGDGRFDLDVPDGELADLYLAEADRLGIPISRDSFNGSDHASFRRMGFRAVCLSQDFSNKDANPDWHRHTDVEIDRAYMESGIDLVSGVMGRLLAP